MPTRLLTPLLALGLLFTVTACENDTPGEENMEDVMAEEVAPMNPDIASTYDGPVQTVAGTIEALNMGLTNIPTEAALQNIDGWIYQLEGAEFEGAEEITDNLESLASELRESDPMDIDGDDIAERLDRLGELTTAAAALAAGTAASELSELGAMLTSAGASLR